MSFINNIIKFLSSDYLSSGLQYFEDMRFHDAINDFQKVIGKDPDPTSQDHKLAIFYITESYIALAEQSIKEDNSDDAKNYYTKVIQFNEYPDVFLKLSQIFYDEGDYENAEIYIKKALKVSPNYIKAMLHFCKISLKKHDHEKVIDYIIELMFNFKCENIEDLEMAVDAIKKGDIDLAVSRIDNIVPDKPKEWMILMNQGDRCFFEEDYESALKYYSSAIEYKENYPDYHLKKSKALIELKRYDEAVESLNKAVSLNPDFIKARITLGAVYILMNDIDKASKQFNFILSIDPENEEALMNLKELLNK